MTSPKTTVQKIETPTDIYTLLGLRNSPTGFQRAHIVGEAFAESFSGSWFSLLFRIPVTVHLIDSRMAAR